MERNIKRRITQLEGERFLLLRKRDKANSITVFQRLTKEIEIIERDIETNKTILRSIQ